MVVWAILKITAKSWEWAAANSIPVYVTALMVFVEMPKFTVIQGLTDQLIRVTKENFSGIRVISPYNAEGYQEEKFRQANHELTKANLFTRLMTAIFSPASRLLISRVNLAIYWIGAVLINNASMQNRLYIFLDMVSSRLAIQIIMVFMILSMVFIMMLREVVSMKRIKDLRCINSR